jgi:hypothetical protein
VVGSKIEGTTSYMPSTNDGNRQPGSYSHNQYHSSFSSTDNGNMHQPQSMYSRHDQIPDGYSRASGQHNPLHQYPKEISSVRDPVEIGER